MGLFFKIILTPPHLKYDVTKFSKRMKSLTFHIYNRDNDTSDVMFTVVQQK